MTSISTEVGVLTANYQDDAALEKEDKVMATYTKDYEDRGKHTAMIHAAVK